VSGSLFKQEAALAVAGIVVAGVLWQALGPAATSGAGAAFALTGLAGLIATPGPRREPDRTQVLVLAPCNRAAGTRFLPLTRGQGARPASCARVENPAGG
jgi:hypothetical protein